MRSALAARKKRFVAGVRLARSMRAAIWRSMSALLASPVALSTPRVVSGAVMAECSSVGGKTVAGSGGGREGAGHLAGVRLRQVVHQEPAAAGTAAAGPRVPANFLERPQAEGRDG